MSGRAATRIVIWIAGNKQSPGAFARARFLSSRAGRGKMFARFVVVLWGILAAAPLVALADEAAPSYEALLSQLKSGFTDIDYGQLRDTYAASRGYDPYFRGGDDEKALTESLKDGDCARTMSATNRLLESNFTNIAAHVYAASCAQRLNDGSSAQYHRKVAQGLLASIGRSGNGLSPQSAYMVVSVDEEYAFLSAGGYRVTDQSLVQFGQHECDAMDVVDGSGAKKTIYFNVDRPWAWLSQKFPPGKKGATAGQ